MTTTRPPILGAATRRVDGRKKVMGRAEYAAEVLLPNLTHAVLVGAAVASGRIERIATAAAERAPGVLLVMTHGNRGALGTFPISAELTGSPSEARPPLEDDHVRYFGQYVAMVVAETLEQARYAASLVDVLYRPGPALVTLDDPRAERVAPPSTMAVPLQIQRGDANAIGSAEVVFEETYTSPAEAATAMEPHAAVASWANDQLVVYHSTQWVDGDQAVLSAMLKLQPAQVRVVAPFIGGMFGSKGTTGGDVILPAIAAMRLGRPVKLVLTRRQVLTNVPQRPATSQRVTLGAARDGTLLAMQHHTVSQSIVEDGYPDPGEYVEATSASSRHLYACPSYQTSHQLVRLDAMKPGWVRAPGEALGQWAIESALDELAYELAMDPVELRRKNYTTVRPEDGKPFSSKHLLACYDRGAERFGWARRDPRPGSMRDGNIRIGWGMATATYPGITLGAKVRVRLERLDGGVLATVMTSGSEVGQGAYTMMSMVAAEELGLPLDRVITQLGDTQLAPCGPTGGSSLTSGTAPAIAEAARTLRQRLLELAEHAPGGFPGASQRPDDFELRDGTLAPRSDPSRAIRLGELIGLDGGDALEAEGETSLIFGENDQLMFQSFGAQFVEVRVDADLGRVDVSRVVGVFDVGRVLNAVTSRSQLIGGIIFGIGQALLEASRYDPIRGIPVTADLASYLVPVHADVREIDVGWIDEPDYGYNAIGCRGLGEIGITGVAAAIANAVYHATGTRVRDLPIALERLL